MRIVGYLWLLAFVLSVALVFAVTLHGFGVSGFDVVGPVLANVVVVGVPVLVVATAVLAARRYLAFRARLRRNRAAFARGVRSPR